MFYYLGLCLVLFSWLAGAYLLTKWHDPAHTTISKHAASSRRSYGLFNIVLIVFGALFYAWLATYLVPKLHASLFFTVLLGVAMALQFATALVPDIIGWRRNIHQYTAWGMALLWIPLDILLVQSSYLSAAAKIVALLSLVYMVSMLVVVVAWGKFRQRFLVFQALYVVAFQMALLAAVYL